MKKVLRWSVDYFLSRTQSFQTRRTNESLESKSPLPVKKLLSQTREFLIEKKRKMKKKEKKIVIQYFNKIKIRHVATNYQWHFDPLLKVNYQRLEINKKKKETKLIEFFFCFLTCNHGQFYKTPSFSKLFLFLLLLL